MAASGPNLGSKIAQIVSHAHVNVRRKMAPETLKLFMQMQEAFFTLTGNEHRATTGGFWRDMLATGKLSGPAADTARFLADGHGQWQTLLAGTATGAAMSGGILDVVTNEFAVATQALLALDPHKLIDPSDAAAAAARGIWDYDTARVEANKAAINNDRFRVLWELNRSIPPVAELREMVNRGLLNESDGQHAIERGGLDARWSQSLMEMRHVPLTPEQLADLVTFGVLTEQEATPLAALSGVTAADFHRLVLGNGQPPSTEQLLFAYRRKVIDKARLLRGITQGPVRNEWFDVLESLGSIPMSTADAISAAVQGHLTHAQALEIATQNGLEPSQFEPLFLTAGSPPGAQEMLSLRRRRLISDAELRQALTETRLKPKYVDLIVRTEDVLPPMVTIRSAYAKGAIDHARALDLLAQHGYSAQNADMILAAAHSEKMATVRHLTEVQVMKLYSNRTIDRAAAGAMLSALGYDPTDIEWIFDLADEDRHQRLITAALNKIRAEYVGRHISEDVAQAGLDVLQIPVDQRDDLLMIWDLERSTVTKTLTLAQAASAFKKAIIAEDDFRNRLAGMGYPPADIDILVQLETPAAAK